MRRSDNDKYLFRDQPDLHAYLQELHRQMVTEISSLEVNHFLTTDLGQLRETLYQRHVLIPPVLKEDQRSQTAPCDAEIDVRHDTNRMIFDRSRPVYVRGTSFTVHVPFEGDSELFMHSPSTVSSNPPRASLSGAELSMTFYKLDESQETLQATISNEVGNIKQHLSWVSGQVGAFNAHLRQQIDALIENRRAKIMSDYQLADSLGIPIRRRDNAPQTYRVPEIRRKPSLSLSIASTKRSAPDPSLELDDYFHILHVIHNMTLVMERSPSVFRHATEEEIRVHFLVQLNAQFEGSATGETFNCEGKTDILLRYNGKNLFIAECKFWAGSKAFHETIDQLLRYVSWRDTKTAILVFNRNKDTTAVLAAAGKATASHPNFKRVDRKIDESSVCYIFVHPQDRDKEFFLTVAIYDVPAVTASDSAQMANSAMDPASE